jgi:hypothetical protein
MSASGTAAPRQCRTRCSAAWPHELLLLQAVRCFIGALHLCGYQLTTVCVLLGLGAY